MKIETNGMIKEAWKDAAGNVHYDVDPPTGRRQKALHPVLDRLGIVPVYREDKIDGSDVASITLAEAYKLAHIISDAELILRRHSLRGGLAAANTEARRILSWPIDE